MQTAPPWITIVLAFISALGLGGWLMEFYRRRFPTALERENVKNSRADFVKKYTDAELVHVELSKQIRVMVDEKTGQLEEILVQRELVHAQQIESFIKKLAEETALKEDYWEQLKDARREIDYWKSMYDGLQQKHKD